MARDERAAGKLRESGFLPFRRIPLDLVDGLARVLDDPDPLRARVALEAITLLAAQHQEYPFTEAIPGLTKALGADALSLRYAASSALGVLGNRAREAVPALLAALRDGLFVAAFPLLKVELTESDVVELLTIVGHHDSQVSWSVVSVLGELKAHRELIAPSLLALLANEDAALIRAALESLRKLEQTGPSTLQRVIGLIEREDARPAALQFLAHTVSTDSKSVEAFTLALRNTERASEALEALGNVSAREIPQDLVPALVDVCRGADEDLRWDAIQILRFKCPPSRDAVSALGEILAREKDKALRREIAEAIKELDPDEEGP